MSSTATDGGDGARRNRIKLLFIMLTPLVVVGLATLVYYTGIGIPESTRNKGMLVQPPRQIDEIALSDADGKPWRYADSTPDWTLLSAGPGDCGEACRARLYLSRQIRVAIGRDADRVQRYYLSLDAVLEPGFAAYLAAEHKDLRVLHATPADWKKLAGRPGDPDASAGEPLYIVDPRGFVMMVYLSAHGGKDTISDLQFLLKYSH